MAKKSASTSQVICGRHEEVMREHPEIKVGGYIYPAQRSVTILECKRPPLPGLTVCEYHVTPETLRSAFDLGIWTAVKKEEGK